MILHKRIYEPVKEKDGYRILIDRLWPRGVSKEKARLDHWLKDIAPSPSLRKWFAHDPAKWEDFKKAYREELRQKKQLLQEVRQLEKDHGTVTLLYAARDDKHNHAVVLQEELEGL